MLGTGLISRSDLVDDPLKVMLCAVNVLLATGAGVPVFGVVVLPTATVGLLRAVLDLNRQASEALWLRSALRRTLYLPATRLLTDVSPSAIH